MARIRSVHPSLWTDEAFVEVSFAARLLWIGLETQADDQGAFEWRPKTLKMEIYPGDNVDIEALLAELIGVDLMRRYDLAGKRYGAIREFGERQRPKKPRAFHPTTPEIRTYTASEWAGSEPVNQQYGTGSEPPPDGSGPGPELRPQMEDGGEGEMERKEESLPSAAATDAPREAPPPGKQLIDAFDQAYAATWPTIGPRVSAYNDGRVAAELIAAGYDVERFRAFVGGWMQAWAAKGNPPLGSLNALRIDALAALAAPGTATTSSADDAAEWARASRLADEMGGSGHGQ